jgi:imidazolonepropionase-like amidohydrolase
VVENVVILVRGERIEAVGRDVAIPPDAEVIDLGRSTVLPGLMDMHTHLTGDPSYGYSDHRLHEWPGYAALVGAKNARRTLLAGFTTVRNVGADEWADVACVMPFGMGSFPDRAFMSRRTPLGSPAGTAIRTATDRTPGRSRGSNAASSTA